MKLLCLLLASLCAFGRRWILPFQKYELNNLNILILIPVSQRLYPIHRWLPDMVQEPPTVRTLQPLAQEDRKMGTDRTLSENRK